MRLYVGAMVEAYNHTPVRGAMVEAYDYTPLQRGARRHGGMEAWRHGGVLLYASTGLIAAAFDVALDVFFFEALAFVVEFFAFGQADVQFG